MATTGLRLAALFGGLALALSLARLAGQPPWPPGVSRPVPPPPARNGMAMAAEHAPAEGVEANLPQFVADSRRRAARAIDDIAAADLDAALLGLGNRFLGSPARPEPPGVWPKERLVLDLTAFDPLSFIEQLLALANSRRVRTRTEAVDRFSDHVRQLRYGSGRVQSCARLRQASLWALAAQRRGYLVDLTPYLPGAQQRRLPLRQLLEDPSVALSKAASKAEPCRWPLRMPQTTLAELPLEALPAARPSLRSGDLFVLRGPSSDRHPDGIGLVEIRNGRLGALLLLPRRGVVRAGDLLALARRWPGVSGVALLRPLPNQDGKADR